MLISVTLGFFSSQLREDIKCRPRRWISRAFNLGAASSPFFLIQLRSSSFATHLLPPPTPPSVSSRCPSLSSSTSSSLIFSSSLLSSSGSSSAVKRQRWLDERPLLFLPRLVRHPGSPSGSHQSQAAKKLRRRKTADAKEGRRWLNSDSSPLSFPLSVSYTRTPISRHGAPAVAGGPRRRTAARGGAVRLHFFPRPRLCTESGQRVHVPAASRDFRVLLPGGAQERLDGGRISGNRVWGTEFPFNKHRCVSV